MLKVFHILVSKYISIHYQYQIYSEKEFKGVCIHLNLRDICVNMNNYKCALLTCICSESLRRTQISQCTNSPHSDAVLDTCTKSCQRAVVLAAVHRVRNECAVAVL